MEETPKEPPKEPSLAKTVLHEIWDFIRILLLAAVIVIPIRYFVAQPFIVKGASMEPNFEEHDYLIIDELSYYFRDPARGEVVVFRYPLEPSEYFIKRVIGLPGETVIISNGEVFVSSAGEEPRQITESYLPRGLDTIGEVQKALGADEYFVMGDNRMYSLDSRKWGALERKYVTGRAVFRAWPLRGAGIVNLPAF